MRGDGLRVTGYGLLGFRNPETPESRNPEIPESRNPEIPKSRNPEIPESRNPEVPDYRITVVSSISFLSS